MKPAERENPREGKTFDPNQEPWLTWLELIVYTTAVAERNSK